MAPRRETSLSEESIQVLRDLNPWWTGVPEVRPRPPAYHRPAIASLGQRLKRTGGLIEIVRGPRQVGKTTGMHQIIQDLMAAGTSPTDILFVRFDLEVLREEPASIRRILRWFETEIRRHPLASGSPAYVFFDEVHKLRRWDEEVKHARDTYPLRMLITGSSSVRVARGGRESLAGRSFTTELPTFSFREVLECWRPQLASILPHRITLEDAFEGGLTDSARSLSHLRPQQRLALRRALERYFTRGGYPRLHSGEVDDDRWADYLVQTVFENVLGADIPDLFPVENPGLLRHLYLSVARFTGQELAQNQLAQNANVAGFDTNQPTVGKYLHYLTDALLIREFRRYPLAKKGSARVPAKITLTDLGVRNAIFRGAPSLWESDPAVLGPLVETMVQGTLRGTNLQVHFFRDFEDPKNRKSPVREVDFVVERIDGKTLPVEVKFRKRIDPPDLLGLGLFRARFQPAFGIVVTRDRHDWDKAGRILYVPLQDFLLAF